MGKGKAKKKKKKTSLTLTSRGQQYNNAELLRTVCHNKRRRRVGSKPWFLTLSTTYCMQLFCCLSAVEDNVDISFSHRT